MWVSYWNKPGVPKYIHCKWQAGPGLAGAASEKKMLDHIGILLLDKFINIQNAIRMENST